MADLRRRGQLAARLSQSLNRDSEFEEVIRYVFAAPEALDEPRREALLLESKLLPHLQRTPSRSMNTITRVLGKRI